MTVKDVVSIVATLLGLTDVSFYLVNMYDENGEIVNPSEDVEEEIKFITRLVNLVVGEIAREYVPLKFDEEVLSNSECEINYCALSKNICDVLSVCTDKTKETFNMYSEFIKVSKPTTYYNVEYCYTHELVNSLLDIIDISPLVQPRTIAYGIASEYTVIQGLYDESLMWDKKFLNSLSNSKIKAKNYTFKKRGWLC